MKTGAGLRACRLGAALLLLWACRAGGADQPPTIRVGLIQSQQQIEVSADAPFTLTDAGQPAGFVSAAAGEVWTIAARPPQGPPKRGAVWLIRPDQVRQARPPIQVRTAGEGRLRAIGSCPEHWDGQPDRFYRGEFEVLADRLGRLTLVNIVDLEGYVLGVVPSEMGEDYPAEALKAQAVAARSETLASLGRHRVAGFNLCDWVHCQAYGGATSEKPSTTAAVEATRGEVLTFEGKVAQAVYFAVCGGHTEDVEDVWRGGPVPYLRGVGDFEPGDPVGFRFPLSEEEWRRYLTEAPLVNCYQPKYSKLDKFRWVRVVPRRELEETLRPIADIGALLALRPLERGMSGRIKRLEVVGTRQRSLIGREQVIRRALGGLRSSAFVVDSYAADDGVPVVFVFWGAGWGHGVGMCQVGAAGLAARGWSYRRILAKYYPGTGIEERYR